MSDIVAKPAGQDQLEVVARGLREGLFPGVQLGALNVADGSGPVHHPSNQRAEIQSLKLGPAVPGTADPLTDNAAVPPREADERHPPDA